MATVLGLVGVVEVGAGVEQIGAPLVLEGTARRHAEEHGHQRGRAIDHRRIHHLPLAGPLRFKQPADHAEGQVHAAAAKVAHQVERRHRLLPGAANGVQGAGQADVVDVVARRLRHGAFLPPAGHAAVDELWVAGEAVLRPEPQALRDTRTKALKQAVGGLHQPQHRLHPFRALEIHADGAPVARQDILGRRRIRADPIHADHFGTHVRQHHAAKGSRPDARQFDDAVARQRSSHSQSSKAKYAKAPV